MGSFISGFGTISKRIRPPSIMLEQMSDVSSSDDDTETLSSSCELDPDDLLFEKEWKPKKSPRPRPLSMSDTKINLDIINRPRSGSAIVPTSPRPELRRTQSRILNLKAMNKQLAIIHINKPIIISQKNLKITLSLFQKEPLTNLPFYDLIERNQRKGMPTAIAVVFDKKKMFGKKNINHIFEARALKRNFDNLNSKKKLNPLTGSVIESIYWFSIDRLKSPKFLPLWDTKRPPEDLEKTRLTLDSKKFYVVV